MATGLTSRASFCAWHPERNSTLPVSARVMQRTAYLPRALRRTSPTRAIGLRAKAYDPTELQMSVFLLAKPLSVIMN